MTNIYPENWPRCSCCDDFALDGKATCGRAECQAIERRYIRPDSNRLRSGGYQPRPSSRKPMPPTTGSGVS